MDKNFTYGGRDFQLGKIDAFKQFHIVRRIAPILADLIPAMHGSSKFRDLNSIDHLPEKDQLDMVAKVAGPVMNGLSKLSDADAELVLFGLLSSIEIKQSAGNWAKVASSQMLMIQDLELAALLQLAGRAFVFNLSSFFAVNQPT